jgi:hypothetical protein
MNPIGFIGLGLMGEAMALNLLGGDTPLVVCHGKLALTSTQRSNPQIVANVLFYIRQTPPQAVLVAEAWPNGCKRPTLRPGRFC